MNSKLLIIAIAIVAVLVVVVVLLQGRKKAPYVLGEEYAKAVAQEQQRKQSGNGRKSPMPAGEYDQWRGEDSLINPVKNSLDSDLSGLSQRFAKSDAQTRTDMRTSINMEEFYTLLTFSQRAAVFAMRERDVNWVNNGLTAIAMIEAKRTDPRDILMPLSLLYHSAKRIGANADQLFRDTAKLSEPDVATLLTGFVDRPADEKDIRASWGFDEVETSGGLGFIGWGNEAYQPTGDLKKVAIEIADLIAKDKYRASSVEVASELPAVWLKSAENPSLESVLKKVRAGASIHGNLRPNEHPTYKSQVLMIFLVEMDDERAAQELQEMSRKKKPANYSMVGVSNGKLFCLVIGESFEQGVAAFETPETLPRFAKGITEILGRYSSN
jgi:hypothetical protein